MKDASFQKSMVCLLSKFVALMGADFVVGARANELWEIV